MVTVLAYVYVNVPAPTAVIATVEVSRVSKAYGLHVEVGIPRIAGGAGSAGAGKFSMRRVYTYKGRRRSVISAAVRTGRIQGRGVFDYSDGTVLSGSVVRTCTVAD